jgi:hypothetical protein
MRLNLYARIKIFTVGIFSLSSFQSANAQIGNQVTEMVTDFNGYWRSGISNINTIKPNNSHNLLAFSYDGVRYSTGVNDAVLTANGLAFTARQWYAVPVASIPGTLVTNTKLGLGALYDGVNPGASNPAPSGSLSYYLTDGLQGLNIGTGIANLPIGQITFDVANLQINAIGNGVPDILITQIANPPTASDVYSFRDASNNIIGNSVTIGLGALNVLGNWTADFYETTPTRMLTSGFTNTDRPLRMWCTDLSAFGLNASNIGSVAKFVIQLSGDSDIGFVAYNSSALDVIPPDLPGGVSKQPSLWLKANNGPSTMTNNGIVSDWTDKSGNANNASQTNVSLRPSFISQGSNFNPTINFGAHALNTFQNLASANNGNYTTFSVAQQVNMTTAKTILGSTGTDNSIRQSVSATNTPAVLHGATNLYPTSPPAYGTLSRVWTTRYRGASGNQLYLDMTSAQSNNIAANYINRPTQLGNHQNLTPTGNANISEVITYPSALTDNEIQRVSSYLAIKYGITLSTNYLSCNSTVLFQSDGSGNTFLYDNRIAGIGRETCQQFNQRQSRSIAPGNMVTIGGGKTIAAENSINTTVIADGSYLMTGDNNGAITWGSGTVAGVISNRIARTWRATVTGTVDSVKIRVPANASNDATKLEALPPFGMVFLMVNTTDNFTSGYSVYPMTEVGSNYEVNYRFTSPNQFFTFGYMIVNPLPVELISFDAIPDHENITTALHWSTATEINNDYYIIENSTDAQNWTMIGRKDGAGNSNNILNYELHDLNPPHGISYYRLKQFDYDGTESIKGIRSVDFARKIQFNIFPNPASDVVYVQGENITAIEVYDVNGKMVHTQPQNMGNRWIIDTQVLAHGVYYFKINDGNQSVMEKVVISKQ